MPTATACNRFDSFSFVYGLEHVRTHEKGNLSPDANGNVPIAVIADTKYTSSSVGPSYSYDSRDNPFRHTRGFRFNLEPASPRPLGAPVTPSGRR